MVRSRLATGRSAHRKRTSVTLPSPAGHDHEQVDQLGAFLRQVVLVPRSRVVGTAVENALYIGRPYSRDEERVVAVIGPERQTAARA
jgi:hypothetical protein